METELIIKILGDIGFTEGESKVYLSLLKLGESKVGPIIKDSGISRSKVYDILDRLKVKGIVGNINKNGTLFFRTYNPSNILNIIKEKKKDLDKEEKIIEEILPTLESIGSKKEVKVTVYEGVKGFRSIINKTINDLGKGDTYRAMGVSKTTEAMTNYAAKIYQVQKSKGFKAESIFDELGEYKVTDRKNPMHKMKVLPKGWHTPALFTVYKDNVGIHMGNDEKVISILIKSDDVAESINRNFEAMWKIAK